ncbi:MAG: hypothetical protein SOZ80_01735 [Prevotella sp.]|nr:hypothetical protein [Prevotella sp.]MDD7317390.1 hypothetical protein [Prevotellaceae bacterium]MDY4019488.1 hypothetical protein [Prevotella sp.]
MKTYCRQIKNLLIGNRRNAISTTELRYHTATAYIMEHRSV